MVSRTKPFQGGGYDVRIYPDQTKPYRESCNGAVLELEQHDRLEEEEVKDEIDQTGTLNLEIHRPKYLPGANRTSGICFERAKTLVVLTTPSGASREQAIRPNSDHDETFHTGVKIHQQTLYKEAKQRGEVPLDRAHLGDGRDSPSRPYRGPCEEFMHGLRTSQVAASSGGSKTPHRRCMKTETRTYDHQNVHTQEDSSKPKLTINGRIHTCVHTCVHTKRIIQLKIRGPTYKRRPPRLLEAQSRQPQVFLFPA